MPTASPTDPLPLAQLLMRCQSVTPADGGALDVLRAALEGLGFACHRLTFADAGSAAVDNLYARLGEASPNFCFAGHTDVVPIGDEALWSVAPFGASVADGKLWGRGAADMKGAVAAFVAATARFLARRRAPLAGSISLLITGDEEGEAVNGTAKVLEWLSARGETLDACLVGEPTNPEALGDMVKIGRRGSLTGNLMVRGVQGHAAYPHLADNPIPRLTRMLSALSEPLDAGNEHFQPSHLEVTSIDVGNRASNVIPATARAIFNVRYNDGHTRASLDTLLRQRLDTVGGNYELSVTGSGEAFLSPPGALSELIVAAVGKVTGRRPELSTSGGTSDARFIKDHCPVAEFGLVGATMHKVDEHVAVADLEALTEIYRAVLAGYFDG